MIDRLSLFYALHKMNRITPYLKGPNGVTVLEVSHAKMRAASSVQLWQVTAEGIPDMQLVDSKAQYLENVCQMSSDEAIYFKETDSKYVFKLSGMTIELAKPDNISYEDIEEVFLKPTLVNDYELKANPRELEADIQSIINGLNPRSIGLKLSGDGVEISGTDLYGNRIAYDVHGTYIGNDLEVAFPAKEMLVLANLLQDETTTMKFGSGTKARPASLLVEDALSGLTAVLSPMNRNIGE